MINAPTDWSPDGGYILYLTVNENTGADLMAIPVKAEGEPVPFANTKFGEDNARISPDGRWVVYNSDESGKNEIYARPFPSGGGKWQVSSSGGSIPMWGPDGQEIFYNQTAGVLMAVPVKAAGSVFTVGTPRKLFEIPRCIIFDVSKDGKQFLIAAITGLEANQPITLVTNWDKELKNK
jgi:dipeptidyl aminopeptidase/acylaminoacyl peptidase